ncbi:hypothetical protein [Paraburkholderia steynii]|uniref:hypothetical protein n=1 Tax=Paraburkholderia steynii TaxID=1245441 RepID=UPI00115FCEB7|nr:hypothetical protein [Paraburkholderia steynii]
MLRLWAVLRRLFLQAADFVADEPPSLALKLRSASTHWIRHTHTTFEFSEGAELAAVRDNLRPAFISMTSIYLHSDEVQPAKQMAGASGAGK